MKKLRICTIGGGSGMPIVNKSLVKAGYQNISSIVTIFDSGGDTGRLRTDERGNLLAFSDYWRSFMSLWEDGERKREWIDVLNYRDGRGRNLGNNLFGFLAEKTGGLKQVDEYFSKLVEARMKGKVLPVSSWPSTLCFKTQSGKVYRGEHLLDEQRMSLDGVTKVWLDPPVKTEKEVKKALMGADILIVCPGSMYGSIMANFLCFGFRESFLKSKARKILMVNIMSTANENNGFDQTDYAGVFESFLGRKIFDVILMSDIKKAGDKKDLGRTLLNYKNEHSFPIRLDKEKKRTMVLDIAKIDRKNMRLRHSVSKLALCWKEVF
jgi:uncharacterized cofD-like protein